VPRHARLDRPGLLQHVMVRGIERSSIFLDAKDKISFLERFSKLLKETGTECFAWALLDNHAHLLLKPGLQTLAQFMRRLLTGYAVTFNLRHTRSGHLFQNRYKSIVCEEESYLLEMVRYIHLNPLRVGMAADMDQLDAYPWSGHAVLMGRRTLSGQNAEAVLMRFGTRTSPARKNYRAFVEGGIARGKRDDLVGGGLKRSLESVPTKEITAYDQRILGSGPFVEALRDEREFGGSSLPIELLAARLAALLGTPLEDLKERTKKKKAAEARNVISYVAVRKEGYNGAELARFFNVTRSAISTGAERGRRLVEASEVLQMAVIKAAKGKETG